MPLQASFNNLASAGKQHSWNAEAERICCDPANSLKLIQAGRFWDAETGVYVMSRSGVRGRSYELLFAQRPPWQ